MNLGQAIAIARESRGLTLRELERRTGISNALISQIETGKVKNPSWHAVVTLARELNLNLARLAALSVVHPRDILRKKKAMDKASKDQP